MTQTSSTQANSNSANQPAPSTLALRKSLFWRIHFWAALIASPFALLATLSGILYIFTPQIETALYGKLEKVVPAGQMQPLDQLIQAAQAAQPAGMRAKTVRPSFQADDATAIVFVAAQAVPAHEHHPGAGATASEHAKALPARTVYINPYTAQVLGHINNDERFSAWAQDLHSRLLQGDNWRWMIELAASWLLVMLITGIYLWWPRGKQSGLPKSGATGRNAWKQWHAFLGVALALMSLIILTTGITWSKYAGEQVRYLRNISGQASPKAPSDLHSQADATNPPLAWQAIWDIAKTRSPQVALQMSAPSKPQGVWRIGIADISQPQQRFDLLLDAYTGNTLYQSGWQQQTAFGKATAIGIPFHRGEFGWWNQALLLVFGVGILFSLVSGWVMFYKRWQSAGQLLPRLLPGAWRASPALWLSAIALCWLLPLLAISSALLLIIELFLAKHRPAQLVA